MLEPEDVSEPASPCLAPTGHPLLDCPAVISVTMLCHA
jgi:hypothetical protein